MALTEVQYLEIERDAETRSEFRDGQMFAIPPGSVNHSLLTVAMGSILFRQLPPGCRAFDCGLRIRAASAGLITYADVSVICGQPQTAEIAGDERDVVLNPVLIVEVLAPSTENYDRGKKFELYRTNPPSANTCSSTRTATTSSTIQNRMTAVASYANTPAQAIQSKSSA